MSQQKIRPGEIYRIFLGDGESKYAIVVSQEPFNRGNRCVAVLLTTQRLPQRARLDNCVFFKAGESNLTKDCVAQCEGIATIPYSAFDFDSGVIGTLSKTKWGEMVAAIGYVLDATCYADIYST